MVNFTQPHNLNIPYFSKKNVKIPLSLLPEQKIRVFNPSDFSTSRKKEVALIQKREFLVSPSSEIQKKLSKESYLRKKTWNEFFELISISDLINIQRTSFQYF